MKTDEKVLLFWFQAPTGKVTLYFHLRQGWKMFMLTTQRVTSVKLRESWRLCERLLIIAADGKSTSPWTSACWWVDASHWCRGFSVCQENTWVLVPKQKYKHASCLTYKPEHKETHFTITWQKMSANLHIWEENTELLVIFSLSPNPLIISAAHWTPSAPVLTPLGWFKLWILVPSDDIRGRTSCLHTFHWLTARLWHDVTRYPARSANEIVVRHIQTRIVTQPPYGEKKPQINKPWHKQFATFVWAICPTQRTTSCCCWRSSGWRRWRRWRGCIYCSFIFSFELLPGDSQTLLLKSSAGGWLFWPEASQASALTSRHLHCAACRGRRRHTETPCAHTLMHKPFSPCLHSKFPVSCADKQQMESSSSVILCWSLTTESHWRNRLKNLARLKRSNKSKSS